MYEFKKIMDVAAGKDVFFVFKALFLSTGITEHKDKNADVLAGLDLVTGLEIEEGLEFATIY